MKGRWSNRLGPVPVLASAQCPVCEQRIEVRTEGRRETLTGTLRQRVANHIRTRHFSFSTREVSLMADEAIKNPGAFRERADGSYRPQA